MTVLATETALGIDRDQALALLREMLRIRRFEEASAELYSAGKIHGFLHLYIGEEAIAAGAMAALQPDDAIVATYREHGHALARGVPAAAVMAEMFGKANGCSYVIDEKALISYESKAFQSIEVNRHTLNKSMEKILLEMNLVFKSKGDVPQLVCIAMFFMLFMGKMQPKVTAGPEDRLPKHPRINLTVIGGYHGTGWVDFSYPLKRAWHLFFGKQINLV